ncbi:MFS transporter [Flexivirga caeni]|uniref:MFS transporter n=1 Tax=Flexivirga caeni TaxID=2294115 RepID=A0A3M9M3W9_9MICO|nr:MFS transporter [Flexivirga caeni]RNI20279.1 MFS transporter [Flexivirga caeni]
MSASADIRLTGRAATVLGASIVLLEFMAAVTTFVASTVLPVVVGSVHASDRVGLLVSGSAIGLFLAMPVADQLIGALGTAVALLAGVALVIAGGITSAVAADPWTFAGGRLVAGFAGGLLAVFGVGAAVRHLDDAIRRTVVAISSAMWILPGLVAPPLIVAAEHLIGWRWTLLLPVPFVVLVQVVIFHVVPQRPRNAAGRFRPVTLLVPAGVAGFLTAGTGLIGLLCLLVACAGFRSLIPPGTPTDMAHRSRSPGSCSGRPRRPGEPRVWRRREFRCWAIFPPVWRSRSCPSAPARPASVQQRDCHGSSVRCAGW